MLAELALDMSRPDEALELANQARGVAESVSPPLTMWLGYAERVRLRGRAELGDQPSESEIEACRDLFVRTDNDLGVALLDRDQAKILPNSWPERREASRWTLASIGLITRTAESVVDERDLTTDASRRLELDYLAAAVAQEHSHVALRLEQELLYSSPTTLASIGRRKLAGQRNLARMATLALGAGGLLVGAIRPEPPRPVIPDQEARAAAVLVSCDFAVWAWPASCAPEAVVGDILRACGEDAVRVVMAHSESARVARVPFLGEPGATLTGIDLLPSLSMLADMGPGIVLCSNVRWNEAAIEMTRCRGLAVTRRP